MAETQETQTTDDLPLTQEELAELQKYMVGGPVAEEKYSVHKFLADVAISPDTTKTGYLTEEEIGVPKNPIRSYKSMSLICKDIIGNNYLATHFNNESEIVTSTSLSKYAKLLELAVVTRRELADVTDKPKKKNKGWFKGKKRGEES